ncbi:MAG: hypothetical protein IT381_28900 [Deltaproteobacteria bacterium]|nr:hypothetical protein [Deltaproteobacteria bacterium]
MLARTLLIISLGIGASPGCRSKHYDFTGYVYDGTSGQPLSGYTLRLEYGQKTLAATVGGGGRFVISEFPSLVDYEVVITAEGYRPFRSFNKRLGDVTADPADVGTLVPGGQDDARYATETLSVEAVLFPSELVAPAAAVPVLLADSSARPAGTARFVPLAASTLQLPLITPAALLRWRNALDAQQATVVKTFADGAIVLDEGELAYGVPYAVDVWGVSGYQAKTAAANDPPYVAGNVDGVPITLQPQLQAPLMLAYSNVDEAAIVTDARLVFVLNQPAQLDPRAELGVFREQLDNAVAIEPAPSNPLKPSSSASVAERGVSLTIDGQLLTIAWSTGGLDTAAPGYDAAAPPERVIFNALQTVMVQAAGVNKASSVPLSALICVYTKRDPACVEGASAAVTLRARK